MKTVIYHPELLVHSNGIQLNYDSFGNQDDPVILLIMGLGTQMIYWDDTFCRMLAVKGYWVVRFDNRDVGKSSWLNTLPRPSTWQFVSHGLFKRPLGADYLLSDMVDDTLGLIDALGIQKAHLVGASMGGMIAQLLAIQAPQRALSLTSIMSTTGNRSLPKASLGFSLKVFSAPPKDKQQLVPYACRIWRQLHGDFYDFDPSKTEALIKHAIERGVNPAGSARQLAAIIDSGDRTQDLQKLAVPSLVIHGESDPLVPVACGRATAKAIPNAKLKLYPGMGHTLPSVLHQDIADTILAHVQSAQSTNTT